MKQIVFGIIAGALVGSALTWVVLQRQAKGHELAPVAEPSEPKRVQHGTNGAVYLKLEPAAIIQAGLQISVVQSVETSAETKAFGHVIDPSALAALLAERESAQAALQASSNEYRRASELSRRDQTVSTRTLELAQAALKKDQILVQAAQTKLVLALGKIAEQTNGIDLVTDLVTLRTRLVRLDLPLGSAFQRSPASARIAAASAPDAIESSVFIGPAPSADPQTQGQGYLYLLTNSPLPPGAAVVGWLRTAAPAVQGVLVPPAALVRAEGQVFVYIQTAPDTFERRRVVLDRPLEKGWFVREGLRSQDKVVVTGAQLLLSEELKSLGGGGEE